MKKEEEKDPTRGFFGSGRVEIRGSRLDSDIYLKVVERGKGEDRESLGSSLEKLGAP